MADFESFKFKLCAHDYTISSILPTHEKEKRRGCPRSPPLGNVHHILLTSIPDAMANKESADTIFKQGFLKEKAEEIKARPVVSRFPPEPNGPLHIGHSKAVLINAGFARYHGGKFILRYDDTNPEAEDEAFFNAILEMVRWLGFKPDEITYSSDNFDKLYELAVKLTKSGDAYVCTCTDEEVKRYRGGEKSDKREECPHRNRPVEESLTEFENMKNGKYQPKEAVLRMKMDLKSGNPQMWDLIAYRVLNKPHHRTGDGWKIYPTYDFTHCICDSLEHITHSLCTTEFELSRVSYDWLLEKLGMMDPKPEQREYGRLNMEGTVMSKRKINELVTKQLVRAWDDPRLFTLAALKRRGVPPGAILSFINGLGVSKSLSFINIALFDNAIRKYLETTVPRLMLVLDPISVIIENLEEDYEKMIELSFGPKDVDMGSRAVPFTKTIYIEREDFREEENPNFYRLTPGKMVGLLNGTNKPFVIRAKSFSKNEKGEVVEIRAELVDPAEVTKKTKPKGNIHWVGKSIKHKSPISLAEVRVFHSLFKSKNPDGAEGGFVKDIRKDSEEIYSNAMVEIGLAEIRRRAPWPAEMGGLVDVTDGLADLDVEAKSEHHVPGPETVRFQGMRNAYFCLDSDTKGDSIVVNRIVSLKEDSSKES